MKSVNKVILLGLVGNDPEVKYIASGIPVGRFSLATNERFKDKSGKVQDRTEWHNIVVWRRLAEIVGEFVSKGSQLYISKGNFKPPAGKTAKARKRNTGLKLWPITWCSSARERREVEPSHPVQIRPRKLS